MVIDRLAELISETAENGVDRLSETFFEPVIRLGVTGLSRTGKTVFITSLVANLLDPGRMPGFSPRIVAAYLQPQPNDTVPRFAYEGHLSALTGSDPTWPEGTRGISELRLSLKVNTRGFLPGLGGVRTVHLDILDYPGEWLLDLTLLDQTYETWSERAFARLKQWGAQDYLAAANACDVSARYDEATVQALTKDYTAALIAAQKNGAYDCTPGRFLLPGDLAGSAVLSFAPLLNSGAKRNSLGSEMARRFEAYKARVVHPFFRDHFARIDRQVVLIDVLGALSRGPAAFGELQQSMVEILGAFRPGQNRFLTHILGGRKVDKILFAATKADHLHHEQHDAFSALCTALLAKAKARADFAGARTKTIALASLRATTEERRVHGSGDVGVVRGRLVDTGKQAAFYPGPLPEDPHELIAVSQNHAAEWPLERFGVQRFLPAPLTLQNGKGPPHIRLDQAAEFLLADRLR